MQITEIKCKAALSKSNLPGLDYSLNPYRGCQHSCAYCYVPNILRVKREDWGNFVNIKTNIPNILTNELRKKKPGVIAISTVTDPYQPVEKKYRLTRYCLEQLLRYDFPVHIQTKSKLILRDIDLISKLKDAEVMFSIGTLNDSERKKVEPFTPSIKERLDAMSEFSNIGIDTSVFFGPIYPTIKIEDISQIVDKFIKHGAKEIMIDKFNLKPGIWENIQKSFPYHKQLIKDQVFYQKIFNETLKACKEKKVKAVTAF
ncbi:DNA repair photolyase [Thermoplasmatales archaeon SCGC AB-539-N05]|nr:DNA repair photolyase [Thermoplasmatales archaeon SCGC AB-539-N05]